MNKYILAFTMALLLFGFKAKSQINSSAGLEIQAYPTGFLLGIGYDKNISEKGFLHLRAGVNIFDHRDLGKQDMEEGSGWGATVGYRRFFNADHRKWRAGIKLDTWFNNVEWSNDGNDPVTLPEGETDIIVLQPTAELAYVFNKNNIVFAPSISFGMEWNVKTDGEPTGEGPILLIGFQLAKVF